MKDYQHKSASSETISSSKSSTLIQTNTGVPTFTTTATVSALGMKIVPTATLIVTASITRSTLVTTTAALSLPPPPSSSQLLCEELYANNNNKYCFQYNDDVKLSYLHEQHSQHNHNNNHETHNISTCNNDNNNNNHHYYFNDIKQNDVGGGESSCGLISGKSLGSSHNDNDDDDYDFNNDGDEEEDEVNGCGSSSGKNSTKRTFNRKMSNNSKLYNKGQQEQPKHQYQQQQEQQLLKGKPSQQQEQKQQYKKYKKSKSENRARKALRTISFILGAFIICWTPYHIVALWEGFCPQGGCVNRHLFYFTYFLCYANRYVLLNFIIKQDVILKNLKILK